MTDGRGQKSLRVNQAGIPLHRHTESAIDPRTRRTLLLELLEQAGIVIAAPGGG